VNKELLSEMPVSKGVWQIQLHNLANRHLGATQAQLLLAKYQVLLSTDYQALLTPRYALQDLLHLQQITTPHCQCVSLIRPCAGIDHYRLHFYSQQERFLDEYIPLLGNLGLRVMDQVQFRVVVDADTLFIKSFSIKSAKSQCSGFALLRQRLLACIQAVMDSQTDNDSLNKLCVLTGLDWQAIDVLRTYRNYFLQLGHRSTPRSVHHALINNPCVALGLFNYFDARFSRNPAWQDPMAREELALFPLRLQLLASLADVADLNDDRILRTLFNLIDATMRSNFHWRKDQVDYFIAIKINSMGVLEMPNPKPQNEIYVHAADMEGIHLRAGKIARGGIRWSDRPDDFRTEILGLMQTQTSKNALIIPTGAKGGFVVKKNGASVDMKEAGKKAYLTLMHGLLDLTDNYHDGKACKPAHIVCHDDPDPYLVVAADKGTASFSDIANGVAAEYDFWLHDAFASGGSRGYDHKVLGITARGAWECVKRHFRELGKDIQSTPFTVIGIGSMDGDVFGNGMLLSPHIRLLAAFSGQHIFLDPNPADLQAALNERQRLFKLPGSSWADYDRHLISSGGGVYLRADKDIPLSPEVKHWLGLRYPSLDGESLIRYLLIAPVELLWLGGIGTYVKASSEKTEAVGDHANDNVRVDARELRVQVVGEGANLGFTQKARIEYALNGGRINTDAVDNSAGVDTSDHEVNLKILLTGLHKQNRIADYQPLFIELTDEVCQQVLANNIMQSLCLSLEKRRSTDHADMYLEWAERLQNAGFLDKAVESFPSDKEILARPGQNLTRPELAVLMAASKMYLTAELQNQAQTLSNDCYLAYLHSYFSVKIVGQFSAYLAQHPLAGEIKATIISNKFVNQAGCGFLSIDNADLLTYVGCYLSFDQIVQADALRQAIAGLDNLVASDQQYQALLLLEASLAAFSHWAVQGGGQLQPDEATITLYRQHLAVFDDYLQQHQPPALKTRFVQFQQAGFPETLAQRLAALVEAQDFPQLVSLAQATGTDLQVVLRLYQDIYAYLGLSDVDAQLATLVCHDIWESQVLADLQWSIKHSSGELLKNLLASHAENCAAYFQTAARKANISRYRQVYQQVDNSANLGLMPYLVWAKALRQLL
jgi:glutamate dehydrogenase